MMQETAQQYTHRILGYVEGEDALKVQRATVGKLTKLIRGLTPRQLKWQPEAGKWSIAEIVGHLADTEIVASWRMRSVLGQNGTTIQAYDQNAWAAVFQYRNRDPKASLALFRTLRENNHAMLKTIPRDKWENYGMHEERGKETLSHLARLFAGHDVNHVLQVEQIVQQLKKKRK
jgi:DinB superfamily